VQKILSAIGDDRIHSSKLELAQHFNGDMDVKNVKSVFKKLIVGKDGCTMLELQWVPDSLKAIGQPENVMGCGAPHLHMFITGCHKVGPKDIPFWGFSQFILGISGACWLVSWPAKFATDLSLPVESLFDIVAHQKKDVFTKSILTLQQLRLMHKEHLHSFQQQDHVLLELIKQYLSQTTLLMFQRKLSFLQ